MINYLQQKSWQYSKRYGFLYLDLMIALVTLSICGLTLGRSVATVAAMVYDNTKRVKALNLATQILDLHLMQHQEPTDSVSDTHEYTITIHSDVIKPKGALGNFCRICVTVAWIDMGNCRRALSLYDGYFDEQTSDT